MDSSSYESLAKENWVLIHTENHMHAKKLLLVLLSVTVSDLFVRISFSQLEGKQKNRAVAFPTGLHGPELGMVSVVKTSGTQ